MKICRPTRKKLKRYTMKPNKYFFLLNLQYAIMIIYHNLNHDLSKAFINSLENTPN